MSKLKIVQDETPRPRGRLLTSKIKERGIELQAKLDRQWKDQPIDATQWEAVRIERILASILDLGVAGKSIVDLGCGRGAIAAALQEAGADVLAVDISDSALAYMKDKYLNKIKTRQDLIPYTNLPDDSYDMVVSTDVVAELDSREHPVFMSELYRLVKPGGWVVCSTPLDVYSVDAFQRFQALAEKHFLVDRWSFSHHRLLINLVDRMRLLKGVKNSRRSIALLESASRWLWADAAVSHALFIGQRKALSFT